MRAFRISGCGADRRTAHGLPSLLVEVWDREGLCPSAYERLTQRDHRALFALEATVIDEAALRKLADVKRLSAKLRRPIPELLPLWAPIDTWGGLFRRICGCADVPTRRARV